MRDAAGDTQLPWKLLGVQSARLEMSGGNMRAEESLGLNCSWYADILVTLTADDGREMAPEGRLPPRG